MLEFTTKLNNLIWSVPMMFLILGAGIFFTVATRAVQFRKIKDMFRIMIDGKKSETGVSSVQAFMISAAGRVGTGNIAGVATAITFGGPGAIFWMWIVALIGGATSFIECTLAQIYFLQTDVHLRLYGKQRFAQQRAGADGTAVHALQQTLVRQIGDVTADGHRGDAQFLGQCSDAHRTTGTQTAQNQMLAL